MFRFAAPRRCRARHQAQRGGFVLTLASLATAALLSGCGVLAAFVPPLHVGDPLGVDGQTIAAVLEEGGIVTPSITTHLDATRTVDLPDLEADLHGFSLAGFHTNAGLAEEMLLSGSVGDASPDYPERLTVTRAVIEAELWDDVNGSVAFSRDAQLALTFERSECSPVGCTYTYAGTEPLAGVLDVDLTDRDVLADLVAILMLRETETPNSGTFRVAIEVEASIPLNGYAASFTLTSTGSTILLGG